MPWRTGVVIDIRAIDQIEVLEYATRRLDRRSVNSGISPGASIPSALAPLRVSARPLDMPAGLSGADMASCRSKYGLGCDQILAARVVSAQWRGGVDTKDDKELLWALLAPGMTQLRGSCRG